MVIVIMAIKSLLLFFLPFFKSNKLLKIKRIELI